MSTSESQEMLVYRQWNICSLILALGILQELLMHRICVLMRFQDFSHSNLYKREQYENMRPKSNQPGRFFPTAKTQKFDSVNDITLDQLKLRPIID